MPLNPRGPSLVVPALVALVLLLAGCSSAAADAPAAGSAPAPSATSQLVVAADGSVSGTTQSLTRFRSETGNIRCFLAPVEGGTAYARCDIGEKTWKADPPEAGCAGTWGGAEGRGSVGVGSQGEASVLCVTDDLTELTDEQAPLLQYGTTLALADITCSVEKETGVTCTSATSQHGFSVSKAKPGLR